MSTKSEDKQAKWNAILEDFNQSGSSITAYCNEHSISVATFSYWKRKLLQISQNTLEFVQVPAVDCQVKLVLPHVFVFVMYC